MDLLQLFALFDNRDFFSLFFKAFAILFSILYLLYAIVISKQTQVMNHTLSVKNNNIITFISSLHITIGLILVLLAILIV
ncbi:MAG: hypothetical protein UR15_C0018G0005 [Parcubacteria group bacterium GW2011_GWA2_31_28]|nr:MAG: hypothetical protein UR15_C0018G0005 [Parcubacteria group bacterium GW2011_GWA2_31_28]